ncbi:hypothetical protein QTO34_007612, partial [Cnephaeus nilssonii]
MSLPTTELEEQNEIIDELASLVENIDEKFCAETRHVNMVDRKSASCGMIMVILLLLVDIVVAAVWPTNRNDTSQRTFREIKEEIARYGDVAKAIIDLAVYGKAQNRSYERLALLVDTVGSRLSGSKGLEKAIQIMCQNLKEDGLENVHLEPVKIPHWERGEESAVMLEPRMHKMAILGLGSSIGTPPE